MTMLEKIYNNLIKLGEKENSPDSAIKYFGGAKMVGAILIKENPDINYIRVPRTKEAIALYAKGDKSEAIDIYNNFIKNAFAELKNNNRPEYALDNMLCAFEIETATNLDNKRVMEKGSQLIQNIVAKYPISENMKHIKKYQKGIIGIINRYEK